jgi:protein SCO1/2
MMQKRKWIFGLVVFVAVLWIGLISLGKWVEHRLNADRPVEQPVAQSTVYWDAPAFSFLDQDGLTVTNQSLRGHVWIADFFFSQCTTACPILTSKLMLLQKQITSPAVRFISFSVDPEHDSPRVLKKYAELWEGDQSRWRLLSTDPAGLTKVATGMKVTVAPSGDKDNPILHSTLFMLVDKQGTVRGIYDSSDSDALKQLVDDTKSLDGNTGNSSQQLIVTGATSAERGRVLFGSMGCLACHSQTRIAPPLKSVYGGLVRLDDRRTVWADDAYLHESIVDPSAKIVAGYTKSMPNYRNYLNDQQVMDLVAYIKSLSTNTPGGHGVASFSTTAPTAELLIDPVCKMQVTEDESGPHVMYHGRVYFFCSDHCKQQFLKNPALYVLTEKGAHAHNQ